MASASYSPPCGIGCQPPCCPVWSSCVLLLSLTTVPSPARVGPARRPCAADAVRRAAAVAPRPRRRAVPGPGCRPRRRTRRTRPAPRVPGPVRRPSRSARRPTARPPAGRSGIGAMAPTAQRTPRRAGSRTSATEAMARPGPVRPVAFRKTCGACSSGTRTKPISSPGSQHLHAGQQVRDGDLAAGAAGARDDRASASRAASTGRASPVGAAVAMLPPRVPALRICGGPAARAAAARAGIRAAKSGRPMRAWVRPAPSRAWPSWYCQPRISLIRPRPTSAAGRSSPELTAAIRSVPPATGTAAGMAAERRHGLVERGGQRHGLRRLRCVRGQPSCPFPVSRRPACVAVRYVLDSPDVATLAHLPIGPTRGSAKECIRPRPGRWSRFAPLGRRV